MAEVKVAVEISFWILFDNMQVACITQATTIDKADSCRDHLLQQLIQIYDPFQSQ